MHHLPFLSAFGPLQRATSVSPLSRNTTIAVSVIALHIGVLWAVQSGLMHRVSDIVLPEAIMVEILSPSAEPKPSARPIPPLPSLTKPDVQRKPVVSAPVPNSPTPTPTPTPTLAQPAPAVLAVAPSAAIVPAASAVTAPPEATSPATATTATANAQALATTGAPHSEPTAPAKVVLPTSDAQYLNNTKPAYPPISKRLAEQGKVVVRVFIDADGRASQGSVKVSSGFDRLDQASLTTALNWRYMPGKRNGIAEGMWFDVPLVWNLK